jgi:hypothetical protein
VLPVVGLVVTKSTKSALATPSAVQEKKIMTMEKQIKYYYKNGSS